MSLPYKLLYYGLQSLRREPVLHAFHNLLKSDFASLDELHHLQFTRARTFLGKALTSSPYYYQRHDAGYPSDLDRARTHEQLMAVFAAMPRLEKRTVKLHHAEFYSVNIASIKHTVDTTSGSSGSPLQFPCDNLSWAYRHASIFRCLSWYGLSVGDRYGYFFGQHWAKMNRVKVQLKDRVFNRIRVSAFDLTMQTAPEMFKKLKHFKPRYFYGYPSAIYSFFKYCYALNLPVNELKLVAVFTTAEPLLEYQRTFIESNFGIRCVNMYGSAEGSNTAFECPAGNLHETIDITLNIFDEQPDGLYKIYVNDLFLTAFPLVNYSLDDYVERSSALCACGRKHPLLTRVYGRSGEPIILPDGRTVNANLPSYVFKNASAGFNVIRYRFYNVQNTKLVLLYESLQELTEAEQQSLKAECASAFGATILVQLHRVPSLPNLANAKHKDYVYSDTQPDVYAYS